MKLPSFQFYPGDWMKDPSLRAASLPARGLWIDMLCLMFESDRRGYLHLSGKPVSLDQLARMTGCSTDECSRLLQELETSGVFSRTEHGTIYSRRLVKDESIRAARAAGGVLGGNPKLKVTGKDNHTDNHPPNLQPTPSSSSSSSDRKQPSAVEQIKAPIAWARESGWSGIDEGDRQQWLEAFPACNLDRQLAAMNAWLVANPAKAKKSNWPRFIVNWLTKEQQRGGDTKSNRPAGYARASGEPGGVRAQVEGSRGGAQSRRDAKAQREYPETDADLPRL